jgi:hypothetical protein
LKGEVKKEKSHTDETSALPTLSSFMPQIFEIHAFSHLRRRILIGHSSSSLLCPQRISFRYRSVASGDIFKYFFPKNLSNRRRCMSRDHPDRMNNAWNPSQ